MEKEKNKVAADRPDIVLYGLLRFLRGIMGVIYRNPRYPKVFVTETVIVIYTFALEIM